MLSESAANIRNKNFSTVTNIQLPVHQTLKVWSLPKLVVSGSCICNIIPPRLLIRGMVCFIKSSELDYDIKKKLLLSLVRLLMFFIS